MIFLLKEENNMELKVDNKIINYIKLEDEIIYQ